MKNGSLCPPTPLHSDGVSVVFLPDWETAPLSFIETARLCRELLWDSLLHRPQRKNKETSARWASPDRSH
ncbi:hypothetical protein ATANTOWER_028394 [Ataeniobius toweri]|uniref:Uncharacterized protein n=1 Tax=Ataeniobius toweri TaxID=208326 RepID=A0ABU7B000_9TELE|nr:hypothetical protein [Ataeniobius toweri]